jgi:hypothetical protein
MRSLTHAVLDIAHERYVAAESSFGEAFVGRGDRFDDDRRLVRGRGADSRREVWPKWPGRLRATPPSGPSSFRT